MLVNNMEIKKISNLNSKEELISFEGDRLSIFNNDNMGILRKILIDSLNVERTKKLLIRYGWNCGYMDALKVKKQLIVNSDKDKILFGIIMQYMKGIGDIELETFKIDHVRKKCLLKTKIFNSFEAEQHLHYCGLCDSPVCWSLMGYAGGYVSALLENYVFFKEIKCLGKGDPYCQLVGKTPDEWGNSIETDIYNEKDILSEELNIPFEKTMYQNLDKSFILFQQKLADVILKGEGLIGITQIVSQFMKGAVFVFDKCFNLLAGNSNNCGNFKIQAYLKNFFINNKKYLASLDKKYIKFDFESGSKKYSSILLPITAGNDVLGFVVLVNKDITNNFFNKDLIILIQYTANVCGLELIKQRQITNLEEQFRGDFIDILLSRKYSSEKSIVTWGLRLGHNLEKPHRVLVMNIEKEELYSLKKDILRTATSYIKKIYSSALCAEVKGNILIFLPEETCNKKNIKCMISNIKEKLEKNFSKIKISFGVGNVAYKIDDYHKCFMQARKALEILETYGKKDRVLFYEE
ncbi:MAG: hypothetical protein PWQ96_2080, partial [Clostridia bacterium]|nr:hypothetical protein [Clostridia bacterium]